MSKKGALVKDGWATVTVYGKGIKLKARGRFSADTNVTWIRFPPSETHGVLTDVSVVGCDGAEPVNGELIRSIYVCRGVTPEFPPGSIHPKRQKQRKQRAAA